MKSYGKKSKSSLTSATDKCRIAAIILTLVSALLSIMRAALTLALPTPGHPGDRRRRTNDAANACLCALPGASTFRPFSPTTRNLAVTFAAVAGQGDQAMEAGTPAVMATIGSGLKPPLDGTEEVIVDLPKHVRLKNDGRYGTLRARQR